MRKVKNEWLYWGIAISVVLLLLLILIQYHQPDLLNLDIHWIALVILPTIVGLLGSGVIGSFKGFGIEISSQVSSPLSIQEMDVHSREAIHEIVVEEKGSYDDLRNIDEEKRRSIKALSFVSGSDKYTVQDINNYLDQLSNVKYFIINDAKGKFRCLLLRDLLESRPNDINNAVYTYVNSIENDACEVHYKRYCEEEYIKENEQLISTVDKVRRSKLGLLPVVSTKHVFLGILTERNIESVLTDRILAVYRQRG